MKHFFFDFADTLAKFKPTIASIIQRVIYQETGLIVDKHLIETNCKINDETNHYSSLIVKTNTDKKYFYINKNNSLIESLGIDVRNLGEKIYYEIIRAKGNWTLDPLVLQTLLELKNRGTTISLASNFDIKLREILVELKIITFFDKIYISEEMGVEKPNPLFFRIIWDNEINSVDDKYFIGDNFNLDYIPSRASGFHAILLDEFGLHPEVPNRITNLNELLISY